MSHNQIFKWTKIEKILLFQVGRKSDQTDQTDRNPITRSQASSWSGSLKLGLWDFQSKCIRVVDELWSNPTLPTREQP